MSTRTKLALFIMVAVLLGGLLWIPYVLQPGAESPGDLGLLPSDPAPVSEPDRPEAKGNLPSPERGALVEDSPASEASTEGGLRREVQQLGSIRGFLTREGEPIPEARVILHRWDYPLIARGDLDEMSEEERGELLLDALGIKERKLPALLEARAGVTDARGSFVFEDLPPGNFSMTGELEQNAEYTQGNIWLRPGETLDLGELSVPVQTTEPEELVRIRVHAYDHDGPVPYLRVNVRSEGELLDAPYVLNAPFGRSTDRQGQHMLELQVDFPISIDLDKGGDIVGGTGEETVYSKGKVHEVWISVAVGHLVVTLPRRIELVRGQALQYVLESSLLSRNRIRSATIIGGIDPLPRAGVEASEEDCKFLDLPSGACTVKATVLEKDERGAWRPGAMRFRGTATVVGGETVTCGLWRSW